MEQRIAKIALVEGVETIVEEALYDLDGEKVRQLGNGRFAARRIVVENEQFNPRIETRTGPETVIEADRVRKVYTVTPLALGDVQAGAHAAVMAEFERRADRLVAGKWGPLERDTFISQEAEARALAADDTAPTPYLDLISAAGGGDKAALAQAIVDAADALKTATAALLGAKRAHLTAIYGAATAAEVEAHDTAANWPAAGGR